MHCSTGNSHGHMHSGHNIALPELHGVYRELRVSTCDAATADLDNHNRARPSLLVVHCSCFVPSQRSTTSTSIYTTPAFKPSRSYYLHLHLQRIHLFKHSLYAIRAMFSAESDKVATIGRPTKINEHTVAECAVKLAVLINRGYTKDTVLRLLDVLLDQELIRLSAARQPSDKAPLEQFEGAQRSLLQSYPTSLEADLISIKTPDLKELEVESGLLTESDAGSPTRCQAEAEVSQASVAVAAQVAPLDAACPEEPRPLKSGLQVGQQATIIPIMSNRQAEKPTIKAGTPRAGTKGSSSKQSGLRKAQVVTHPVDAASGGPLSPKQADKLKRQAQRQEKLALYKKKKTTWKAVEAPGAAEVAITSRIPPAANNGKVTAPPEALATPEAPMPQTHAAPAKQVPLSSQDQQLQQPVQQTRIEPAKAPVPVAGGKPAKTRGKKRAKSAATAAAVSGGVAMPVPPKAAATATPLRKAAAAAPARCVPAKAGPWQHGRVAAAVAAAPLKQEALPLRVAPCAPTRSPAAVLSTSGTTGSTRCGRKQALNALFEGSPASCEADDGFCMVKGRKHARRGAMNHGSKVAAPPPESSPRGEHAADSKQPRRVTSDGEFHRHGVPNISGAQCHVSAVIPVLPQLLRQSVIKFDAAAEEPDEAWPTDVLPPAPVEVCVGVIACLKQALRVLCSPRATAQPSSFELTEALDRLRHLKPIGDVGTGKRQQDVVETLRHISYASKAVQLSPRAAEGGIPAITLTGSDDLYDTAGILAHVLSEEGCCVELSGGSLWAGPELARLGPLADSHLTVVEQVSEGHFSIEAVPCLTACVWALTQGRSWAAGLREGLAMMLRNYSNKEDAVLLAVPSSITVELTWLHLGDGGASLLSVEHHLPLLFGRAERFNLADVVTTPQGDSIDYIARKLVLHRCGHFIAVAPHNGGYVVVDDDRTQTLASWTDVRAFCTAGAWRPSLIVYDLEG
eukprot:jgi/Ulvmu1/241/UM001_0245.1